MTLNQTYSAYHYNREYGAIDTDKSDVNEFENIFQGDWNQQYRKVSVPQLIWSPNNSTRKLLNLIQSAKKTLIIEAEELDDKSIENLLIRKAQDGVDVRMIMSPQTNTSSQKHIDSGGVHLRILNNKDNQLYMHAKMIVADNRSAYIGSENPSSYSLKMNRELGVLIDGQNNIQTLVRAFDRDWKNAKAF